MRKRIKTLIVAVALLAPGAVAQASGALLPLAQQGDWIALAHHPSMIAPPDVCIATTPTSHGAFLFWTDGASLEARILNNSWSLPSNVTGNIEIKVPGADVTLPVSANTNTVVGAEIGLHAFRKLVAAMNDADSMTVTVGKAAPTSVSLNGSTVVMRAFETCADIPASTQAPKGANPFK